jgi:hypothetical protein
MPEERHHIWKNIVYYQQSNKDVTLEIEDVRFTIFGEQSKDFQHSMD